MSDDLEYDEPALPHDTDAERIVLGAMLLNPGVIDEVADLAPPDAFYHPQHAEIADAILALRTDGKPTDAAAVLGELRRRGSLTRIGGGPYLHRLIEVVPFTGSAAFHAEAVRDMHVKRIAADTATSIRQMALDPALDRTDIAEAVHIAIGKLNGVLDAVPGTVLPTVGDLFVSTCDDIEKPQENRRVSLGIADLDAAYNGGVAPGQFTVVGARTAVGKSQFGLGAARSAAVKHKIPTLLASLEMGAGQIMRRLIAAEAGVNLSHLLNSACDDRDWQLIGRVAERVMDAPLYIDDKPGLTLERLHQTVRDLKRHAGCGLVVIDYLQLMIAPKAENREQKVAALTRGLKLMSQELDVPIVAMAQLNRDLEKRQDKTPVVSDLRESGAIENDADNIILLHREDMHDPESPRAGEIDLIAAKNRDGARTTISAAFQGHYARIVDMARPDWTPHAAMRDAA
jgi:replicative DNA helicase